jgi:hypothetical protein
MYSAVSHTCSSIRALGQSLGFFSSDIMLKKHEWPLKATAMLVTARKADEKPMVRDTSKPVLPMGLVTATSIMVTMTAVKIEANEANE